MNYFYLDHGQKTNAFSLCDQHRSRMIYETTQLLCNTYHSTQEQTLVRNIYKEGYANHPCSKWAKTSIENFNLMRDYLGFLFESYYLHGGTAWTRERTMWMDFCTNPPNLPRSGSATPPYLAFGSEDKEQNQRYKDYQAEVGFWNKELGVFESKTWDNALKAYRTYYCMKQFKNNKLPTWKKNTQPDWYQHLD